MTQGMHNDRNAKLLGGILEQREKFAAKPNKLHPWLFPPCVVRVLLVSDGGLDFSADNFGLSAFVEILATETLPYVRFQITVGHRDRDVTGGEGNPHIAANIGNFRFDDPAHFSLDKFEQVWIFSINSSFRTSFDPPANELEARNQWAGRPTEAELKVLSQFMNNGGGLFATGDHGALGSALGGFIPRARSMRKWFYPGPGPFGEPGSTEMTNGERHDTNRLGHDSISSFDDQSDDIPQPISPKMYTRFWGWRWYRWPHPLLCGHKGPINVLPDHPHEGECSPPHEIDRTFQFDGFSIEEYPSDSLGRKVLPEVIATSTVLSGSTAGFKDPTRPHSIGAISAYDGARANVGRVVTDATWHHFININLVGDKGVPTTDPKYYGFLASTDGQAHLEAIKNYYLNIAQWIAPPAKRRCMLKRGVWYVTWNDRLLEAVTPGIPMKLGRTSLPDLIAIGGHARDVLGRLARQCQTISWLIDLTRSKIAESVIDVVDPWGEPSQEMVDMSSGMSNPSGFLDIALGAIVVAIREVYPDDRHAAKAMQEDSIDDRFDKIVEEAVNRAAKVTNEAIGKDQSMLQRFLSPQ
jgi:hypothetical protein